MSAPSTDLLAVLAVLALPLAMALVSTRVSARVSRRASRGASGGSLGPIRHGGRHGGARNRLEAFRTNAGGNGALATFAGAVAGNVGVGSFLAIFLFGGESPVIAASIVAAYSLGLVGCAVLAPRIRARSRHSGATGLIDMLVLSSTSPALTSAAAPPAPAVRALVWLPVALVFVLRSAVQVGALALIAAEALGVGVNVAILGSALVLGGYLVVGGYRAAVLTDMAQATVLLAGMAVAAAGLGRLEGSGGAFTALGPHGPALLVAIWLFLPWSGVLAVDNWQRIVVARSDKVATGAYLAAAATCAALFAVIAMAGVRAGEGADMRATFVALMPDGYGWLVAAMLVACILSSVDTFVMPLAASLGPGTSLTRMRLAIVALVGATAACALAFGDIIATVITAFNGLAVFVPAALGALYGGPKPPFAAAASMNAGLAGAVGFMAIDQNAAALVGFALASVVYLAFLWSARARRAPGGQR